MRSVYYIRIKGTLNPASFSWLDDIRIINQDNHETLIAIPVADQSALRGLLDQFWNFNFTILSVERTDE